ncbi:hypothetical protein Ddc_11808 [Ditylenchus destructor]|nr:hypothetical protein Ddc_11808 [Ditylenchus destructor]
MTGVFECYECHEEFDNESLPTFPNLDSLAMHIWKLHYNGNEFQHACDQCMTGFITEERLFDHLRSCKHQPHAVHDKYEKKLQVYKILNRSLVWMMEKRKGETKTRAVQTEKCSTSFGNGLNTSTASFSMGLNGSDLDSGMEVLDSGYAPSATENGSSPDSNTVTQIIRKPTKQSFAAAGKPRVIVQDPRLRIVSNKDATPAPVTPAPVQAPVQIPAPVQAPVQIQAAMESESDDDIECVGFQPGINPAILYLVKSEPVDPDENMIASPPASPQALAPAQQQNFLSLPK